MTKTLYDKLVDAHTVFCPRHQDWDSTRMSQEYHPTWRFHSSIRTMRKPNRPVRSFSKIGKL